MTHINQRRDTAANWTLENPVLQPGEMGWETNTRKGKLGDGVSPWNDLDYISAEVTVTAADVGLGEVDNTSDLDKPISSETQAALNNHMNDTSTHGVGTVAGVDEEQTLTNKTLIEPKVEVLYDTAGNKILEVVRDGTDLDILLAPKGVGVVRSKGVALVDESSEQVLTHKKFGASGSDITEPWSTFVPTLTATTNPTYTVNNAKFQRIGKTVHVRAYITITAAGTGTYAMTTDLPAPLGPDAQMIPVVFTSSTASANIQFGYWNVHAGFGVPSTTAYGDWNGLTSTAAVTSIRIQGTYECV